MTIALKCVCGVVELTCAAHLVGVSVKPSHGVRFACTFAPLGMLR
ncbi:MAG: hypothetical protein ACLP50_07680 [Solirubrobacteraceae bacterium]